MKSCNDLFWLAANAYHEARGEPFKGQKAVCHVVLNRAKKRRQSIKGVVLAPMQFSWYNGGVLPPIKDYESFIVALKAASATLKEQRHGEFLQGADHYFADYIQAPAWSKSMTRITKIGRHIFFRS